MGSMSPFVSVIYSFSFPFSFFFFFLERRSTRVGSSFVRASFLCASEAAGSPLTLDTASLGGLLMAREGKEGDLHYCCFLSLIAASSLLSFVFGVIVLRKTAGLASPL